jgi:hypothetical protein
VRRQTGPPGAYHDAFFLTVEQESVAAASTSA